MTVTIITIADLQELIAGGAQVVEVLPGDAQRVAGRAIGMATKQLRDRQVLPDNELAPAPTHPR